VSSTAPGRRMAGAVLAALVGLGSGSAWPGSEVRSRERPNVIVVLTDDQHADTFEVMPWLRRRLAREGSGWLSFPNAFANTPLCCPARASLLTGRYARHTGVLDNRDGGHLDESSTLATWLHEAGYRTGFVGKYLNRYPFGRLPYVPPGWDRFVAKRNQSGETVYRDFRAVDQGSPVFVRRYATDWLAERAVDFVRTAPTGRPFFLLFAPSAPHPPWIPAKRHDGAYDGLPIARPPNVMGVLRGAPPWVRSLPEPSAAQRAAWLEEHRRANETLLAVDEALRAIVQALGDRLDDTYIFVLSDNGYSFGEHRWAGKKCPYEACVRIPLAVYSPAADGGERPPVVSIVDLAPTIMSVAGVASPGGFDGQRFSVWIEPRVGSLIEPLNEAVFLEWAGDAQIPAWTAVRTAGLKLIRYEDGVEELYDIGGRIGSPDPWELVNRVADPRYEEIVARLGRLLDGYVGPG
jgi:N-acetylglucosamine-6-sulfatase